MGTNKIETIAERLADRLRQIDYEKLDISSYNKHYIARLKPHISYYLHIYAQCLEKAISLTGMEPEQVTLIDYGGGSGFLSMLAHEIDIRHVIYIDLNPNSVETIKTLKRLTGNGPDTILHGSSVELHRYCLQNSLSPDMLIATDLIEHVYDLRSFFSDLHRINPRMPMVFTTGSTPYNPYVKRRLRKMMQGCESGTLESPNYQTARRLFIQNNHPELTAIELDRWVASTRGLTYEDIDKALKNNQQPTPEDTYNTCDPCTGNWAERILPIQSYRASLSPFGYQVKVSSGLYNPKRSTPLLSTLCRMANIFIKRSGKLGLYFAPFIYLSFHHPKRSS